MPSSVPMGAHGVIELPLQHNGDGAFIRDMTDRAVGKLARSGLPGVSLHGNIRFELHVDNNGKPFVYFEVLED